VTWGSCKKRKRGVIEEANGEKRERELST